MREMPSRKEREEARRLMRIFYKWKKRVEAEEAKPRSKDPVLIAQYARLQRQAEEKLVKLGYDYCMDGGWRYFTSDIT